MAHLAGIPPETKKQSSVTCRSGSSGELVCQIIQHCLGLVCILRVQNLCPVVKIMTRMALARLK
jgi:hypothetical protein